MKTLKKVPIRPEFVETMPDDDKMEEGVLYVSHKFRTAIHMCLCGCRIKTVTPFERNNKGWELSIVGMKVTMTPSIGNQQFPCGSHYIITNGIANFV